MRYGSGPRGSMAIRVVAALALSATSSVRGCSFGARPICVLEPESEDEAARETTLTPPWRDAGEDAARAAAPRTRERCYYPSSGPEPPPELSAA